MNKEDVLKNKNDSIFLINKYLDKCLLQDDKHIKKANLLSYWFKDYINYIEQEETFVSSKLKSYSRGDIIKVNLGFNVGSEEGGLHYCVVLDKKNTKSYSTLTVIPLSSLKPHSKINKTSVILGNEISVNVIAKARQLHNSIDIKNAISCQTKLENIEKNIIEKITEEEAAAVKDFNKKYYLIEKIIAEAKQMKYGSIALINQITTVSKQRIYNPKKDFDILSGIKLSDEKMNLIDEKIKKLYIN